jgi:hypothetical protein
MRERRILGASGNAIPFTTPEIRMQAELALSPVGAADTAIGNARRTSALAARVERVFDAMRAVIEAPCCRLKHYRQDFYQYDRAYLERTLASGRYGWVIRHSGTHLVQLGRHPKMHEEIVAALESTPDCDCYLVDTRRASASPVSAAQLREALDRLEYTVHGAGVSRGVLRIAALDVRLTPWSHGESPKGVVRFTSAGTPLELDDLVALVQIAECEVVRTSQSLFTGTKTVTLDGEDLRELIAQRAA